MALIFVVEDNENLREAVISYLKVDGYNTQEFGGIENVFESIADSTPDLLILDVMLPDGDGFQLAEKIRLKYTIPIIFLTARDSESSRIKGFEIGCDDYIVKPFSPKELVLRVKALLKRINPEQTAVPRSWSFEGSILKLDSGAHNASINGNPLEFTAAEWKILDYLATSADIIVDRQSLLTNCLDYSTEMSERTIITHIKNIRLKLGSFGWIETVRGFGYKFVGDVE